MILSPRGLRDAASTALRLAVAGRVADLRPMPAETVADGPGRTVSRYRPPEGVVPAGPPVLLVPPPAVPAQCFDLRRGCSLAEHSVRAGRLSYLLDPGTARSGDADLGVQGWVRDVLPGAVRAVSRDAGGQPVQLVGWCLGGILALLAAADDPALPIASVAAVAAPVDAGAARLAERYAERCAEERAGLDRHLLRQFSVLTHLGNADFLAQIEAMDHFRHLAIAHPGGAARRIYRSLLGEGALPRGEVPIGGRRVDLGRVGVPVLAIAGRGDLAAPVRGVRSLAGLLCGAPQVRVEVAPGGHLGVLTGRAARSTTWRHLDRWLDEGIVRHGIRAPRAARAALTV
ncbi:alpha/beta hydrolase [Actinomadura sp. NAK00032]|uniref:alpha/beta fold hydrolase n=1 Tax=Actinomadura sp. NAK00032 TaxID=2742128 RepID=UPI00158FDD53|nr:alpha/beta fold hydrolase [Actinomadura sp. NAK00032]QKW37786.1 alpha/beta hydrolase [Actinomadura sp. NAK00032]